MFPLPSLPYIPTHPNSKDIHFTLQLSCHAKKYFIWIITYSSFPSPIRLALSSKGSLQISAFLIFLLCLHSVSFLTQTKMKVINKLLHAEQIAPAVATPLKTVNFYTIVDKNSIPKVLDIIRKKTTELIQANPWLAGRLIKSSEGICLVFDDEGPKEVNEVHFYVENSRIRSTDSPALISTIGSKLIGVLAVKERSKSIKLASPLFTITIAVNEEAKEIALFTTMSHVIGDGRTYYQIHYMLSCSGVNKVVPLESLRHEKEFIDASQLVPDAKLVFEGVFFLMRVALSTVFTIFENFFWGRESWPTPVIRNISSTWIEEEKKKAVGPSFVSTNDILTSWFLSAAKSNLGMMAINLIGRYKPLKAQLAGNYESCVIYGGHEDVKTPQLIRASIAASTTNSIKACKRRGLPGDAPLIFPSFGTRIRVAVTTNWAGFYDDVNIPGLDLLYHQPLLSWFDDAPPGIQICIIYSPKKGQISIATNAVDTIKEVERNGSGSKIFV